MRGKISIVLVAIVLMSCSKESFRTGRGLDYSYGRDIPHNMIVLGDRLENPYTTENMSKALQSLYPTRADRVDVKATNLYVRFLPADDSEYEQLRGLGKKHDYRCCTNGWCNFGSFFSRWSNATNS